MTAAILGAACGIVAAFVIVLYNKGVALRNQQSEAWSGVDVQLKKRHDLVPALVECVKGYAGHERGVQEAVTAARGEAEVTNGLRRLIAVAEAYPELKASENFRNLSSQLVLIEDDLQYARRYFNGAVRDFRNYAETFPSAFVAAMFQFKPSEFFEVESVFERNAPEVNL